MKCVFIKRVRRCNLCINSIELHSAKFTCTFSGKATEVTLTLVIFATGSADRILLVETYFCNGRSFEFYGYFVKVLK